MKLYNDSTLVDYQQFTEIKDYFFATVLFCLRNMILDDRFAFYGINKSTYLEFLKGEAFENELITTNYQNMTNDNDGFAVYPLLNFKGQYHQ